jgi:hypothetical protein
MIFILVIDLLVLVPITATYFFIKPIIMVPVFSELPAVSQF